MNEAGMDLLKHYEGFRKNAYLDIGGKPTIGFGFTKNVKMGDECDYDDACARLQDEVALRETDVLQACSTGHVPTANQFAALVCLAYNIGIGHFLSSTVLRMHNAGKFQEAADAFRLWNKCAGVVSVGLVRRREAERTLYLTP